MTPILELRNLSKYFRSHWTYRSIPAVADVTLAVGAGESFGFLGQNGAGKTTTMKCILGLLRQSTGEILLEGRPLRTPQQRGILGYLPELPYFYDHLTVFETLELFATLHDIPRSSRPGVCRQVLERVGLIERASDAVRTLSKGLQQRLAFAQAIVNQPRLLLLDEPFSGLDPVGRREMRELLLELKQSGTTLFISSHVLSDIEEICDRVSVMSKGSVKSIFTIDEIPGRFGQHYEIVIAEGLEANPAIRAFAEHAESAVSTRYAAGVRWRLTCSQYAPAAAIVRGLMSQAIEIVSFRSVRPSLEEIFVSLTAAEPAQADLPPLKEPPLSATSHSSFGEKEGR